MPFFSRKKNRFNMLPGGLDGAVIVTIFFSFGFEMCVFFFSILLPRLGWVYYYFSLPSIGYQLRQLGLQSFLFFFFLLA